MPDVSFEPDLGGVGPRFSSALTVTVLADQLVVVGGDEGRTDVKGIADLRLTLSGVVYEVPIAYRRRIRAKHGGRVYWETATESGSFRYYQSAPPVFLEEDV